MDYENRCDKGEGDDHGPVDPAQCWLMVEANVDSGEKASEDEGQDPDIIDTEPERGDGMGVVH